ncbi:LysR family transcriptional regulator [Sphingomonas sp. IC081]|uniref:LysR family transcriptional regulator n=1 Tax=Sphingomonas sp. IC081 TaxID=304378 RepID=UPI001157C345|nr:LysR family transcriptional regulator [Sphingomonas sp. IC081]QDK34941.1 GntR family transcriptional regulator [Sphingomonas sp. IC081]
MLNLTTLKLFIRVAELGSLSRAADDANLAIGAISRRLSQLEHELGVPLLVRNGRGVALTPAGDALLVHAHRIMREVGLAVSDLSDYAKGLKGSVDILACTSAITQFLPADLAAFGQDNGKIRLNIQEVYSSEIVGRLRAGEAQVGVIMEEPGTLGLDTWKYRCDRLAVVAPPHVLFGTHSVRFQDLAEHEFVQMGYDTANTRLLARSADEQGWPFRLRAAVDSYDAVCRMIQAGFGIGILPSEAAKNFIVPMGLKLVELDEPWALRQMLLAADAASLSGPARLLVEFLAARAPLG